MTSTTAAHFIVASAFSTGAFDGNPAAVIFVDLENIELSILQGLSRNFNQPMMAFISQPTSPEPGVVSTRVRYMSATGVEVTLCGHATIVATAALLSLPEYKDATPPIREARFHTLTRGTVTVDVLEGGWFELSMPAAVGTSVPDNEAQKLAAMFNKAFNRELKILNIETGGEDYPYLLMAEIEESEDLRGAAVDVSAFKDSKFSINGVTSRTTSKSATEVAVEYHCRMFSPILPGGEDPVCGSLQTLLVPYWSQQKEITPGTPFIGLHVGPRGGVVQAVWDKSRRLVKLRGQTQILSRGECFC